MLQANFIFYRHSLALPGLARPHHPFSFLPTDLEPETGCFVSSLRYVMLAVLYRLMWRAYKR